MNFQIFVNFENSKRDFAMLQTLVLLKQNAHIEKVEEMLDYLHWFPLFTRQHAFCC